MLFLICESSFSRLKRSSRLLLGRSSKYMVLPQNLGSGAELKVCEFAHNLQNLKEIDATNMSEDLVARVFAKLREAAWRAVEEDVKQGRVPSEMKHEVYLAYLDHLIDLYFAREVRVREEAGVEREKSVKEEGAVEAVVVLDQMWTGLGEVVADKVGQEVWAASGGVDQEYTVGRVRFFPVKSDYDIYARIRDLAQKGSVVFVTGDKKLARSVEALAPSLPVRVLYVPPAQVTKEIVIERILKEVRRG